MYTIDLRYHLLWTSLFSLTTLSSWLNSLYWEYHTRIFNFWANHIYSFAIAFYFIA